jgi:hypothetical protein
MFGYSLLCLEGGNQSDLPFLCDFYLIFKSKRLVGIKPGGQSQSAVGWQCFRG